MSTPTATRFKVGDVVYYKGSATNPAVFGVIIVPPPLHTPVKDSETNGTFEMYWEGPDEEHVIDIPGSGTVMFLPDNERKYFVKWINKQASTQNHTEFTPLTEDGEPVFNISLHFEGGLRKAPDFIAILRKRVKQTKKRNAELVIRDRLALDANTTRGIANAVGEYF